MTGVRVLSQPDIGLFVPETTQRCSGPQAFGAGPMGEGGLTRNVTSS
jgi:hypothetical protein